MREFIIQANDADQRLDKYLSKSFKKLPTSLMYKYIRNKKIKVNKARCEISTKLQVGDSIQMYIAEDFFEESISLDFLQCKGMIEVVYEDENLLIVNKPTNLLVHSDIHESIETLSNQILKYLYKKKEYVPASHDSFTPACVNRLDRNTCGLVIACKNANSLRKMNEAMRLREIEKHYLCIVSGKTKEQERLVHGYQKDELNNKAILSENADTQVELEYCRLAYRNDFSLCDVHLITGKSHQIRAQMAYIGHPLLGDSKYQGKKLSDANQALCAYRLLFHIQEESLVYLNELVISLEDCSVLHLFNRL